MNSAHSRQPAPSEAINTTAVEAVLAPSCLDELVAWSTRHSPEAKAATPHARGEMETGSPDSSRPDSSRLDRFIETESVAEALELWLGEDGIRRLWHESWARIARQLQVAVARIDRLLNEQVLEILHHPEFQKLEATWRGMEYLVNVKEEVGDAPIKIRMLNVKYAELFKDFDKAVEFDQSQLFRKVYEEEFGSPGGEPFGVLIADFDVQPHPDREHPFDDVAMLRSLSQVAAAAFCPIVLNASPAMFGHDHFAEMQPTTDYERIHQDLTFLSWRSFRDTADSRFIGLAMPRMLLRRHYADRSDRQGDFPFVETVAGHDECLWGGAGFALGEVLMRSFASNRWLADIRGAQRDREGGGIVHGIGAEEFSTESRRLAEKPIVELQMSDALERQMVDLGFLPLCACKDLPMAAFFSCASAQKPRQYQDEAASANARISSMLNYMLCVSRFAHYVKVIGRDKIGAFADAGDLEGYLQNWINGYVTPDSEAHDDVKAQYPLREASLRVIPTPGKPGTFECVFQLSPHYELEHMQAAIKLRTELVHPA